LAQRDRRRLTLILFEVDAMDRTGISTAGMRQIPACANTHALPAPAPRGRRWPHRRSAFRLLVSDAAEDSAGQFAVLITRKIRELAIHHPRSPVGRVVTVSLGIGSGVPGRQDECALLQAAAAELGGSGIPAADCEAG
jgi:hypothetical protein